MKAGATRFEFISSRHTIYRKETDCDMEGDVTILEVEPALEKC